MSYPRVRPVRPVHIVVSVSCWAMPPHRMFAGWLDILVMTLSYESSTEVVLTLTPSIVA